MRYRILGTFEVVDGNRICTPTAPKLRRVLALLLLHANSVVTTQSLIEELWADEPPRSALTTVQTYIYQLRKILELREAPACHQTYRMQESILLTKPFGYLLRVQPGELDLSRFEQLVQHGQQALDSGDIECASTALRKALALWRRPALADIETGPLLAAQTAALEEQRMNALELAIEADLRLGRHRELIGELKSLVIEHQLHEWFHAQLMLALHRSGRRAEALEVYQRLRRVLNQELGLEPSSELQRRQRAVLAADPTLELSCQPRAQVGALVS
jgi:DNA-binding SARP family transcriptional activator